MLGQNHNLFDGSEIIVFGLFRQDIFMEKSMALIFGHKKQQCGT